MATMNYNMESYSHYPFIFSKNNENKIKGFKVFKEFEYGYSILDLEIGRKYYNFDNGKLRAFKVLSIAIYGEKANYDIVYADGSSRQINALITNPIDNKFIYNIFLSKEMFMKYRETKDKSYKFMRETTLLDILEGYEFCLHCFSRKNLGRELITPKVYFMDNNANCRIYTSMFYDSFWIDAKGLHFESHDSSSPKLFWSEIECENSIMVEDFEDEPNEEETITYEFKIPKSKSKEFVANLANIGYIIY